MTATARAFALADNAASLAAVMQQQAKAMQPLLDTVATFGKQWAAEIERTQSLQKTLATSAKALSDAVREAHAEARPQLEALQQRRKALAEKHAGLSARIGYALEAAEKRGTATHFLVVKALSGDEVARRDLQTIAHRTPLAACVLALISELEALQAEVLALVSDIAETLACIAFAQYENTEPFPPRFLLAGTSEQNSPPRASLCVGEAAMQGHSPNFPARKEPPKKT